jgi:hypothetical protein
LIKFLGRDAESGKWSEDFCQMYVIQEARRAGYDVAASLEAGKRSKVTGSRLKAMGMVSGEPDLRFYLPRGKIKMVELKTAKGKLSDKQLKRHEELLLLGHDVATVYCENPVDGWGKVKEFLEGGRLGELAKSYGI